MKNLKEGHIKVKRKLNKNVWVFCPICKKDRTISKNKVVCFCGSILPRSKKPVYCKKCRGYYVTDYDDWGETFQKYNL